MRHRNLWTFLIGLIMIACCHVNAHAGKFGPFEGSIVDAETKEPIEGVVVLFEWLQSRLFGNAIFIDVQEALTDKDGKFYIPGIWVLQPWRRLNTAASVFIYKSGYGSTSAAMGQMSGLWDALLEIEWGAQKGTFIWKLENDKPVLMLKKLTMEERKKYGTPGTGNIPHEKKKLLIQEINKERTFFKLGDVTD